MEGKFGELGKPGSSKKTYLLFSWNFHNFCFVCLSFTLSLSLSLVVLFLWFLLCEMVKSKQDAPRRSKNYYYSQQYSRYYMASKSPSLCMCVCVCVWDASIIFLTLFTFCIFIVASPCASCAAFVAFNQLRRVGKWEERRGSKRRRGNGSIRRGSRARQRSCLCWTTHKAAAWMRAPDSKSKGRRESKVSLNKEIGGVEGLISPFRGRNLILIELLKC